MQSIAKMEKHYEKLTTRMESDTSESKKHGIKVFYFDLTGPLLDFESAPGLTNHPHRVTSSTLNINCLSSLQISSMSRRIEFELPDSMHVVSVWKVSGRKDLIRSCNFVKRFISGQR